MKVEKMDHIAIFVKDLDKAKKLFSDLLGTEFTEPVMVEQLGFRQTLEPLGIEFVESTSPDGPIAKTIELKGEGVGLIGLKVPDLEEAVAEMESRGFRLVSRVEQGQLKAAQFHPKDTFGVMIELLEYKEKHPITIAMLGQA